MKFIKLFILLTMFGVIVPTTHAAIDGKTYPGAMCKQIAGNDRVLRLADGGIYNNHDAEVRILCPIVHDDLTNYKPWLRKRIKAYIDYAKVNAVDNNDLHPVHCEFIISTLRSHEVNSNYEIVDFPSSSETTGASYDVQHIISHENIVISDNTQLVLACALPPAQQEGNIKRRSGIVSYRIHEKH